MNKQAYRLILALTISILWATLSGLVSFTFFGLVFENFGETEDDFWKTILYPVMIFLFVFLIVFSRERKEIER